MPIVELTINGVPKRVDVGAGATPDDLDEIAATLGGGGPTAPTAPSPTEGTPGTATTSTPSSDTWYERAGGYLKERGEDWWNSVLRLDKDILGQTDRPLLEAGGDVATVAGPVVAPWQTAAGVLAGAGVRAAGGGQTAAELADLGVNLATGLGIGGTRGVRAVTGGNVERTAEKLTGGTTEEMAGEVLERSVPPAARQLRETVQAQTYDEAARLGGQNVVPTAAENRLSSTLGDVEAQWGKTWHPAEQRVADTLNKRLSARFSDPKSAPLTYEELDAMKRELLPIKRMSGVRNALDEAMDASVAGTPAGELRAAGHAAWGSTVKPARKIAKLVNEAGTSDSAFQRTIGKMTDAGKGRQVRDLVGADSQEWTTITEGFYSKLFRTAADKPEAVARKWSKLPPEVRQLYDPTGATSKVMTRLGGPTGAARAVGRATTIGGGLFAGYDAIDDLKQGNYQAAATKLAVAATMLGGQGSRTAARFAGGAAPTLAGTAVGAAGRVIPNLDVVTPKAMPGAPEDMPAPAPQLNPIPAKPKTPAPQAKRGSIFSPSEAYAATRPEGLPAVPIYPDARGFVFHHSGGTSLEGLRATLQERGLGSQYLMDRDGTIYSYGGKGSPHIQPNDKWGGDAPGLSNQNAVGMEVVARDDSDITPAQVASARRFIAANYPETPVYGHGEINPGHKQATEGATITNAIRDDRGRFMARR